MDHVLHVVSGIPGTRVMRSLERLRKHAGEVHDHAVSVFSLEQELRAAAEPLVRKLFGAGVFPNVTTLSTLLLPKEILREVWVQSFNKVWDRVLEAKKNSDVLLTLHLAYYHHLTAEYLSPTDILLLASRLQEESKSVVTLIDDIYDCYPALFVGGVGRFGAPHSPGEAMIHLLQILEWRSIEILVSNATAAAAEIPHQIFAVKHPLRTFHDLLFSSKAQLYISHPISEPRRLVQRGKRTEAIALVQKIDAAVARLREKFVVIEPTTIDELRFQLDEQGEPTGKLEPRWPFSGETADHAPNLVYSLPPRPDGLAATNAFPIGWDAEHRVGEVGHSQIARRLFDGVRGQINGRDHHLAEQVSQIANYRPIFEGNPSNGVKEELKHLERLMISGRRTKAAVAFHPSEDQDAYAPRQIREQLLPSWQQLGLVAGETSAFESFVEAVSGGDPRVGDLLNSSAEQVLTVLDLFGISVRADEVHLPTNALGASEQVRTQVTAARLAENLALLKRTYLDDLSDAGRVRCVGNEEKFFAELS